MRPTVLFFCGKPSKAGTAKHAGICAYARQHNWTVRCIYYRNLPVKVYLNTWRPCGIITDNGRFASSRIPTVYLDANVVRGRRLVHDNAEVARLALAEFSRLGLSDLAYLPPLEERPWSDERRDAFLELAQTNGRTVHVFKKRRIAADTPAVQKSICKWLKTLPRPCGLFAAHDNIAELLIALCPIIGIRVPEDLAIISVDNDQQVCENTFPSLTSIAPAFREAGLLAAEALDRLMHGTHSTTLTRYGELGIVRRDSTKRLYGRTSDIREARDLILHSACLGLKARDVVKLMHGSRRSAELRFKAETGRTILQEIERIRIQHAQKLLAGTNAPLWEIACQCGYASSSHLRKAFARTAKTTMGAWRTAQRPPKPNPPRKP